MQYVPATGDSTESADDRAYRRGVKRRRLWAFTIVLRSCDLRDNLLWTCGVVTGNGKFMTADGVADDASGVRRLRS